MCPAPILKKEQKGSSTNWPSDQPTWFTSSQLTHAHAMHPCISAASHMQVLHTDSIRVAMMNGLNNTYYTMLLVFF